MEIVNTKLEKLALIPNYFENNIIETLQGRNYFAGLKMPQKSELKARILNFSSNEISIEKRFYIFFDTVLDILNNVEWNGDRDATVRKWQTKELVINSLLLELFLKLGPNILGKLFNLIFPFCSPDDSLEVVEIKTFNSKDQYKFVYDLILRGKENLFLIELKFGSKYPVEQYAKALRMYNALKKDYNQNIIYILISGSGYNDVRVLVSGSKWATNNDEVKRCRYINPDEYFKLINAGKKKSEWKEYLTNNEFMHHKDFPIYFRSYDDLFNALKSLIFNKPGFDDQHINKDIKFIHQLLKSHIR